MTKTAETDIALIRALADILRESDLTEIELSRGYGEDDELTVRLSRAAPGSVPSAAAPPAQPAEQTAAPTPEAPPAEATEEPVTSPMVGTVYLAPEPGSEPFVKVGEQVSEGQTILIIEAMKTMNHIPSPVSGTVRAILVANAEPVEYGAPLMVVS